MEGHLQFLLPTERNDGPNRNTGEVVQIPSSCLSNSNKTQMYSTVRIQRKGGISLDMCNFQFIGEVGDDCFVKVGAGVTRHTLNEALRCVIEKTYLFSYQIACVIWHRMIRLILSLLFLVLTQFCFKTHWVRAPTVSHIT